MQFTRREALDEFLDFVGESNDSGARNVAERELNNAITAIAQSHKFLWLLSPAPFELTLVVNQRSYALPPYFGLVQDERFRNLSSYGYIYMRAKHYVDEVYPRAGTSVEIAGRVKDALFAGHVGVQTQPASTGDALELVSSDVADVGIVVTIGGTDGNGVWQRAQYSLNGTTPVAAGTWSYIDEGPAKSYPFGSTPVTEFTTSRGTVTLRKAGAGATLQSLLPAESAREHDVVTFYPKPSTADIVSIPFYRRPARLLNDGDPLPDDWWPAIKEEMLIQWRVNTGELATDSDQVPRPKRNLLIEMDNLKRPRPQKQPFTGFGGYGGRCYP